MGAERRQDERHWSDRQLVGTVNSACGGGQAFALQTFTSAGERTMASFRRRRGNVIDLITL
jgi:hypothetical protein